MPKLRGDEKGEVVIERGIPWSRDRSGRIHWWYDDEQRWVPWRPGDDSPPPPPDWQPKATRTRSRRLVLRAVPAAIALAIVIAGFVQASGSGKSTPKATQLVGKCLQVTTVKGQPHQQAFKQVPCTSTLATLKVTKVVPAAAGGRPAACPAGTTGTVSLTAAGSGSTTVECVTKIRR